MPAVLYTQELAWSSAIYIKDDPCCRGKYRILPRAMWMVAAHQFTNLLLPHSMWFGAPLGISVCSLSVPNQPLRYCHEVCRTNSCRLLAHKCVPHSKTPMWTCIQTVQTAARRQPAWISYYCISWWLHQCDLLSQIKPSQNFKLGIAYEHKNCSQDVPPLPTAQRSARSPPEAACSWAADIWAPKGSVSQYTTPFTLLLYGRSFTDIPAHFVADGCTQRL